MLRGHNAAGRRERADGRPPHRARSVAQTEAATRRKGLRPVLSRREQKQFWQLVGSLREQPVGRLVEPLLRTTRAIEMTDQFTS
jgi:hypothetical protein